MWSRRVSIGIGAAVAFGMMAASAPARADSADDDEPRFNVEFQASRPGVTLDLTDVEMERPCGQRCVVSLPEGRYRVVATTAEGVRSAQFLNIHGSGKVVVTPHNHTARKTAFVLMPIGSSLAGVGIVLLWYAGFKAIMLQLAGCSGDCFTRETSPLIWPGGAIVLGVGGIVGLTGVVLWKTNMHADLDVTPLARQPARERRVRLGLLPAAGPRWAGLALTGSF